MSFSFAQDPQLSQMIVEIVECVLATKKQCIWTTELTSVWRFFGELYYDLAYLNLLELLDC